MIERMRAEIAQAGGWISFARYMELALQAYYGSSDRQFGARGDFVTAPELGSLFGRTLARQIQEIEGPILELGAGTGALADTLLKTLEREYLILETSGALRARQAARLAGKVKFLDALPDRFSGVVIANEVVDAIPVHAVGWRSTGIVERGVSPGLTWEDRPAKGELLEQAKALEVPLPYDSEIGLAARAWMRSLAERLEQGVILVIDYGFPRHEYYHPQRATGTIMCHTQHRAHADPFVNPGEQDITAHVDFSALARGGARSRPRGARLRDAGAVPRQLRHHRRARRGQRGECAALRADRRRGAEAALAGRDGRAVQGARRRARRETTAAGILHAATVRIRSSRATFSCWSVRAPARRTRSPMRASAGSRVRTARCSSASCRRPSRPRSCRERNSRGAKLVIGYCVQCHNLANPAMHHAEKWPGIVQRMVLRMQGKGNMGTLMAEMMAGVKAPNEADTAAIIEYLGRHSQTPLDPARYPEVNRAAGEAFRLACNQCHVLPDPQRHTAQEWRAVVARMQENMEWMNRVVGSKPMPGEPRLAVEEINAFLAKYARR